MDMGKAGQWQRAMAPWPMDNRPWDNGNGQWQGKWHGTGQMAMAMAKARTKAMGMAKDKAKDMAKADWTQTWPKEQVDNKGANGQQSRMGPRDTQGNNGKRGKGAKEQHMGP